MNQRAEVNQCGQPPKQENKPSNDTLYFVIFQLFSGSHCLGESNSNANMPNSKLSSMRWLQLISKQIQIFLYKKVE